MKLHPDIATAVSWSRLVRRNAYPIVSVVTLCLYFFTVAAAILFVVREVKSAFAVDETKAQSQVVTFDLVTYEKISERFNDRR